MKTYHLDNGTAINQDLRIQIAEVTFTRHNEPQSLFVAPTINDEYHTAAAYITTNGDPVKIAVELDGEWVLTEDRDGETFDFSQVAISVMESALRWERDRLSEWSNRIAGWIA